MKNNSKTIRLLSLILVLVLTAAAALAGCSGAPAETTTTVTEAPQPAGQATELGEGGKSFEFTVVDKEGNTHLYIIRTDAEMVGQALLEQELIAGEEGPYGLYIKSVLGVTLDYTTDGMYWGFYVNGEYAMLGVDQTPITEGDRYMICAESA